MEGRWALPARGSRADAVLIAVAPAGSAPDGEGGGGRGDVVIAIKKVSQCSGQLFSDTAIGCFAIILIS